MQRANATGCAAAWFGIDSRGQPVGDARVVREVGEDRLACQRLAFQRGQDADAIEVLIALAIAMPLITVWTTVAALFGGILSADLSMGITPA